MLNPALLSQLLRQARLDHAARIGKKVSLRDVSKATGVPTSVLSDLETGKVKNPTIQTVGSIASFYKIEEKLADFIFNEGRKVRHGKK